jgi:hypothetical protein
MAGTPKVSAKTGKWFAERHTINPQKAIAATDGTDFTDGNRTIGFALLSVPHLCHL